MRTFSYSIRSMLGCTGPYIICKVSARVLSKFDRFSSRRRAPSLKTF